MRFRPGAAITANAARLMLPFDVSKPIIDGRQRQARAYPLVETAVVVRRSAPAVICASTEDLFSIGGLHGASASCPPGICGAAICYTESVICRPPASLHPSDRPIPPRVCFQRQAIGIVLSFPSRSEMLAHDVVFRRPAVVTLALQPPLPNSLVGYLSYFELRHTAHLLAMGVTVSHAIPARRALDHSIAVR